MEVNNMSDVMDDRNVQATTIGAGVTAVASLVAPGAVGTTLSMAGASGCASAVGALKAATSLLATPAAPVALGPVLADPFFFIPKFLYLNDEKLKAEKLAEEKLKARLLRALKKLAAQKATATAHAKKGEMEKERGVQLWKNGPFWADRNIGAENPWDSGYYFRWGDTVGYKLKDGKLVASDKWGSKISFDYAPSIGSRIVLQKAGRINNDEILVSEYDAAQAHLHGSWRMPTKHEFDDLCNKCDWTWTKKNGVNGYVVCGKDEYASKSIFLPSSGQAYGTQLLDFGSLGYYWSSVPSSDSYNAWSLGFCSASYGLSAYSYRYLGRAIRPVQDLTK
jgi:hypothetical protein